MPDKPSVLFVCVHNAGRSQMAAGFLTALSDGRVEVRSAGSMPGRRRSIPPRSRRWPRTASTSPTSARRCSTTEAVQASDVVITMGCGDACPIFPGKRYEDWVLDDPAGQGIDAVRPIRDAIRARVEDLISELLPGEDAAAQPGAEQRSGAVGDDGVAV